MAYISKLDLTPFNRYNVDIEKCKEVITGELTYLGTFTVSNQYKPSIVFLNREPNLVNGHKDIVFMCSIDHDLSHIAGMSFAEFEKYRYQEGIQCNGCGDVIYSTYRHECRRCSCAAVYIDGGRSHCKIGYNPEKDGYKNIKIDFLLGTYKVI